MEMLNIKTRTRSLRKRDVDVIIYQNDHMNPITGTKWNKTNSSKVKQHKYKEFANLFIYLQLFMTF